MSEKKPTLAQRLEHGRKLALELHPISVVIDWGTAEQLWADLSKALGK